MKDMRRSIEEESDPRVRAMMEGLRGANMDTADWAQSGLRMNLIEVERGEGDDEVLPQEYDPEAIASYWDRRPVSIIQRCLQLVGIAGGFLSRLAYDAASGRLGETEVARAIDLRNIMTSLGPAYIKLGQALSIRPDLLSPAAMNEMQKLCDKVPSFDSKVAMRMIEAELGQPWHELYQDLTVEPIAAASLGQVYKGRLYTGEQVAVKVQRPYVLETVTVDLYIIRTIGLLARKFLPNVTKRADIVALLDEWAARFFEELDYVKEGQNATRFAEMMREDLPQVVVPLTYSEYTSRRVLTTGWMDGEKLSQSDASDVGTLVNVGVICFLKQLLEHGFFHADPHPGNLIRTPDGRLGILDFGLVTVVDDDIKFGMIEAISHLIHRDYEAIVEDFVTLQFIPEGTDLQPILPVLSKVFDQALAGGGAKSINFQELAADLAQITFDYPFRIPPYFALIIRAISVLEGIALVGDSDFAIVDEAYPYIAKRLLTDDSPRLRAALKYMVYGKSGVFDADRLIDLLGALEDYSVASTSALGNLDTSTSGSSSSSSNGSQRNGGLAPWPLSPFPGGFPPGFPPFLIPGGSGLGGGNGGFGGLTPVSAFLGQLAQVSPLGQALMVAFPSQGGGDFALAGGGLGSMSGGRGVTGVSGSSMDPGSTREALRFIFSPKGVWFREFVMDELVKSIDAMSRGQVLLLVRQLGLQGLKLPIFLPGARRTLVPLAPVVTEEDQKLVDNVQKIFTFLTRGESFAVGGGMGGNTSSVLSELLPVLPQVATEIVPELVQRLASRIGARLVRDLYL